MASLDPATYWQAPDPPLWFKEDWLDPEPEMRGMLSADRIRSYVDLVRMIYPFKEGNLKPASYGLTLGPMYQINGKDDVLTPEKPVLEIPRNSIVFVSVGEWLRLPHYIAARFNLKIDLIYRGLLLGTGPQVDPGFQGVLSCPLHNISNWPIRIRMGHHLATIDFIKTTGIAEEARDVLLAVKDEDELYQREAELLGKDGNRNHLFDRDKRWARPILGYPPGENLVESSLEQVERAVSRFKLFGLGGAAAALTLLVTVLGFLFVLYQDVKGELAQKEESIEELRQVDEKRSDEQRSLEQRIDDLQNRIERSRR